MLEKEEIILISEGESKIDLKTLNSLFSMIDTIISSQSMYDDPVESKVLPFEEGSFKIILEVMSHPLVATVIGGIIIEFFKQKIKLGGSKGNFKAIKCDDGTYDIIHDDGTISNTTKDVLKLIKDPKLNKDVKKFIKNYKRENRTDFIIETKKEKKKFSLKELINLSKVTNVDTIIEKSNTYTLWVEVETFGFTGSRWKLTPLEPIQLTNSKAKIDAQLNDIDNFNKFYSIDDQTFLAKKIIKIDLLVMYEHDDFTNKISGTPKYFIEKIYDAENVEKLSIYDF